MKGTDVERLMEEHVDRLLSAGAIRSRAVEAAFRRVPRHHFVDRYFVNRAGRYEPVEYDPERPGPEQLRYVYSGAVLITRVEGGMPTSSSSDSVLVARMLEEAGIRPGMRVLEIGTGTGFNAALLAELTGDARLVTTIEYQEDVAHAAERALAGAGYGDVRVVAGDGFLGEPRAAPYDLIVVTVGSTDLSPRWVEQLEPGGTILFPLRIGDANPLIAVHEDGDRLRGGIVGLSGFMAIKGALADAGYHRGPGGAGGADLERAPAWPDLGPPGDASDVRGGLWLFATLTDPRTRITRWNRAFGLVDPGSRHVALVDDAHLSWTAGSDLKPALERLHDDWLASGSPGLRDFTADTSDAPGGGRWTLRRPHHRWHLSLRSDR